jgi:hypothetical protein
VWHRAKVLTPMDAHLVEATIKTYLTEIRNRLDKAAGIGRAADACAGAGFRRVLKSLSTSSNSSMRQQRY